MNFGTSLEFRNSSLTEFDSWNSVVAGDNFDRRGNYQPIKSKCAPAACTYPRDA